MCIPFFYSGIEFHAELRLHVGHWFCSFSLAVDGRVKFTVFNGTIANERMFSLNIKREKWHQLSASSSINQNERVRVHRSQWCRTFDWPMPTTKSNIPTVKKICSFFCICFVHFSLFVTLALTLPTWVFCVPHFFFVSSRELPLYASIGWEIYLAY